MAIYTNTDYDHVKIETVNPDDINYSPHFHTKYEMLYIIEISKDAFYNLDSKTYRVAENDLLLIKPGTLHNLRVSENTKYERIVISFSENVTKPELSEFLKTAEGQYHLEKNSPVWNLMRILLYNELNFSKADFSLFMSDIINLILAHLKYMGKTTSSDQIVSNDILEKILAYINENITAPLNAEIISKKFFISTSWLSHNFKNYMNISLKKYINNQKILYIEKLVSAGIPISKAVESCSYINYSTFFKQYKQYANRKPTDIKKKQ